MAVVHSIENKVIDGAPYYILRDVPVVKAMVLNGALLPEDEIRKTLAAWNLKPVVFGHPKQGDKMVSAAEENQLENHVGFINKAYMDKNRMRSDIYLKKNKIDTDEKGQRLLHALERGIAVNVSTAYFDRSQNAKGAKDGREFGRIQTTIAPDHLAILLDEDGACSCKDGCGINVNQNDKGAKQMSEATKLSDSAEEGQEISTNQEIVVSDEIADAVSSFMMDLEEKVLSTNAAMAAGAAQSFETCKKAIDDLTARISKLEGKGKKKKLDTNEDDGESSDSDEEDFETMKAKNKKADMEEKKKTEDEDKKVNANVHDQFVNVNVDFASKTKSEVVSRLNYNSHNKYLAPRVEEYLLNQGGK